ncbi:copper amine oxidase N-terminal domain-containing protein [Anaerotignum lactatifermentans]|uniref:Copper amine oxidase N-terminal domain-containing protein n=1 Tax=Anaerotignum lactatifermentans TaxID=160404 RepID=A0ABS2G9L5_9FIRM|nr:copper amine oxidase N-terminal domain-containing protein [Anaerotignum lactatifermentans]MBM6829060.1 copper amine oxidase N-terminal domain-containing protein [Anaerotignum lactatifermentans]MBM6877333.1 copper amine oxidase N-terminal domain-containing protein [Anaerotignum lactatifermentans]MBM6950704.1 copper amine oxidase N-terminal domain-containing protein [Anaerotignum lactatifermentans]
MKRVLSLVLTAAIAASLVPATAFAAGDDIKATAKVIGAWTRNKDALGNGVISGDVPELQLKVTSASNKMTGGKLPVNSVTVTLDNADFDAKAANGITIVDKDGADLTKGTSTGVTARYKYVAVAEDTYKDAIWKYLIGDTNALEGYQMVENTMDLTKWYDNQTDIKKTLKKAVDDTGNKVTKKTAEENMKADFDAAATDASNDSGANKEKGQALGFKQSDTAKFEDYALGSNNTYFKVTAKTGPVSIAKDQILLVLNGGKEYVETYTPADMTTWWGTNSAAVMGTDVVVTVATDEVVGTPSADRKVVAKNIEVKNNELTFDVEGFLYEGDVISVDLYSTMKKTSKNATVSVDSKMVEKANDLVYVSVADKGFTASVKKTVKVAQDEVVFLHENGLKLKESVKDSFQAKDKVTLKLNKGFKFSKTDVYVNGEKADVAFDGNEMTFEVTDAMLKAKGALDSGELVTLTIKSKIGGKDDGLKIEADGAKTGAKATITAQVGKLDKVSVEVAEVVDYKVVMSTDKDKDLPVIYSGTNVNNEGITNSSNHKTVEITLEETFPGAWSMRQGFNITLPDGVYVADVEVKDAENFFRNGKELGSTDAKQAWQDAFEKAYKDGKYKNFEFGKRTFDDVNVTLAKNPAKVTFVLVLVADPGFEGDVKVGFEGALVDKQSVSAAKFAVPYKVEAQQNDLKIDTRNTKIPTNIIVKETADGLWDKKAKFTFNIEKNLIRFEDDAKFTADKDSGLAVTDTQNQKELTFSVKTVSDKAATVTISDMSLFMDRNIPAGKYALEMASTMTAGYDAQKLYANEDGNKVPADGRDYKGNSNRDNYISDVTKYKKTVKDSFINVVTAPRDEDGFTTKITVPVGEKYIVAGEKKIEIDTPAYINDKGYTMLPLRAVAVALGIDNNSVLWDQNTRTATILYGNRVVSMQAGASTMYINGQAVATKAGVEITNDRTFLSLRDLGTAVNVKDITWDGATKTAFLNYGEKAAV